MDLLTAFCKSKEHLARLLTIGRLSFFLGNVLIVVVVVCIKEC